MAPRKPAANPFDEADEAQTTTNTNVKENQTVTFDSSKNEVVATFKGGTGFESPWVVIHTPDLESMDELLSDRDALQAVLAKTWAHGKFFADQAPAKPAANTSSGGSGNSAPRPPAPKGPAAGTSTPDCDHGQMTYREGVTKSGPKTGETWKAFMCPAPQGSDQCKPQWIK